MGNLLVFSNHNIGEILYWTELQQVDDDADKLPTGSGYNLGHQGGGGGALVLPGGRQNTLGLVISNRETNN